MTLIAGSLAAVVMIALRPQMLRQMADAGKAAGVDSAGGTDLLGVVWWVMIAVVVVLFVLVPGGFVLFYRSPQVRATCEVKDHKARWTDRRPLPILGLTLMLAMGVLAPFYLPISGGMVYFGVLLRGAAAVAVALGVAAASAWCAWRVWQLDVRGWWASLILWMGLGAANARMLDPETQRQMYEATGVPPEQIEDMAAFMLPAGAMLPLMALVLLGLLAFFLYTRQYFTGSP